MVNSPAEEVVLLVEQRQGSTPHRESPEPRFSEKYSQSPRLRPLHQGLVGRQSIIYTSLSLFLPVLFGLAFGLGHHFFYCHLDGTPVTVDSDRGLSALDQQWVAQIGVAFVFMTKTCFAAAISTAFVQRAWMTVSQKPLPLSGIDSLWSILGNPVLFTSVDMLAHAKIATILALAAWLAPLATIPSTGSLRIVTQNSDQQLDCRVPSIDLSNSSSMPSKFYSEWGTLGEYTGSSPAIESIAARVLTGGSYIGWSSPCGYNCTYTTTYAAPKYQCSNAQANGTDHVQKWQATDIPGSKQDTLTLVWAPDDTGSMLTSSCTPYNATYYLKINYVEGVQSVDVLEETTHDPIATPSSTTFGHGDGAANLAGVKDAFVKGLKGTVDYGPSSGYATLDGTLAGYTKMANLDGVPFFQNVSALVEDYMRNTSISLLATSPPPPPSSASCLTSTSITVYQYKPTALIAGYGALFFVSLICALVGVRALLYLGGGGVNSFSLVVSTTRNRKLDTFFMGDGGEKVILSQKPRFKYDMIEDDEGNLHYAFTQHELSSSSLNPSEVSSQAAVESGASFNTPALVRPMDMTRNESNDQGSTQQELPSSSLNPSEVSSQAAVESGTSFNTPALVRPMDNESNDQGATQQELPSSSLNPSEVSSQAAVESGTSFNTPALVRPMDNESNDQGATQQEPPSSSLNPSEVSSQVAVESGASFNTLALVHPMDMNESNDQGGNLNGIGENDSTSILEVN